MTVNQLIETLSSLTEESKEKTVTVWSPYSDTEEKVKIIDINENTICLREA